MDLQWTHEVEAPIYGAYEIEHTSDGCVWIPECGGRFSKRDHGIAGDGRYTRLVVNRRPQTYVCINVCMRTWLVFGSMAHLDMHATPFVRVGVRPSAPAGRTALGQGERAG